jgi:ribosomal protein L12E/L44/L45/RPP1/RPP2
MLFTTTFSETEFAHVQQLAKTMGADNLGDVIRAAVAAFTPAAPAPAASTTPTPPAAVTSTKPVTPPAA